MNPQEPQIPAPPPHNSTKIISKTVKTGISFGSCLAMVISYVSWHSIP